MRCQQSFVFGEILYCCILCGWKLIHIPLQPIFFLKVPSFKSGAMNEMKTLNTCQSTTVHMVTTMFFIEGEENRLSEDIVEYLCWKHVSLGKIEMEACMANWCKLVQTVKKIPATSNMKWSVLWSQYSIHRRKIFFNSLKKALMRKFNEACY